MLKAVLFDLDDTLIDWSGFSGDWHALESEFLTSVYDYICREVHPLQSLKAFIEEYRDRTVAAWMNARDTLIAPNLGKVLFTSAISLGVPPGRLDVQRCLEAYPWNAVYGTNVFPDVIETLLLLNQNGIKIGIVTNAYQPMWMRDREIHSHGLLEHFPDCRISAADVGFLKPHPAIFQAALGKLEVAPEETVFVGDDLEADIGGAQNMGMRAVLRKSRRMATVLNGVVVPDETVTGLHQLPAILDKWFPGWSE